VGMATVLLGAGRERKGDLIDHGVGVVLHKKVGDPVTRGEPLLTVHANQIDQLAAARPLLLKAFRWDNTPPQPPTQVHRIIQ
jgi:pyrimidine-nucleoside phosphorylase